MKATGPWLWCSCPLCTIINSILATPLDKPETIVKRNPIFIPRDQVLPLPHPDITRSLKLTKIWCISVNGIVEEIAARSVYFVFWPSGTLQNRYCFTDLSGFNFQRYSREKLSINVQIFRLKGYMFAIPITSNELHEAAIKLEGMFHFYICTF